MAHNSSTEDVIKSGLHIFEHAVDPRLSGLPGEATLPV